MAEQHKILLVEDSPADAELLQHLLRDVRQRRFTLVQVGRLDEAISRARSSAFDVLLLDLNLPDSRGIATVERACAQLPDVPVIVLTGVNDEDLGVEALHRGAQDYLVKGECDGWATWRAIRYAIERNRAHATMAGTLQLLGLSSRRPESDLVGTAADLQKEIEKRLRADELHREREELRRASLAELTNVYATAPIGLALLDRDCRFVRINERLAAINGRPVADHIGRAIREILPDLADTVEPLCRRVLQGEVIIDVEIHGVTGAEPREPREWLVSCYPLRPDGGDVVGVGVVVQDITERKRMQRSLQDAHASLERRNIELRQMSIRLCRAEQVERERIAEVLHDDLQQLLCAAKLGAGVLLKQCEHPELRETAGYVDNVIDRSLGIAKSLVGDLAPPILTEGGLIKALEWLGRQMERMHGLEVRLQAPHGGEQRPSDTDVVLYQCVRELLFNVVKHAKVKTATVRVQDDDRGTTLEVRDDGVGFSAAAVAGQSPSSGFGLRSLRERLGLLDGTLTIDSQPGHGSGILIFVPASQRG